MTEKTFHISGKVKNLENQGVPNLRVEAWDKDLFIDDFVAEAVTDPDGRFHMSFPDERFREFFFDRRPDLYFKVRKGSHVTDEVIADTSDSILWNVESGVTEIPDIEVDLPVEEEPEPEPEVAHRLIGQLLNEETIEPLARFTVRAFDLDAGTEPKYLGYDITNGQGLFVVTYTTPAQSETSEGDEEKRKLRFRISEPGGIQIHETDVEVVVDSDERLKIKVPAEVLPQPVTHPLDEVAATLELDLPESLVTFLNAQGIHTLEDIRRAGGIRQLEGLPVVADDPAVMALEAHAVLTVLSPEVELNAKLIDKGFSGLAAIAQTSRSAFVSALHEEIGDYQAALLHKKASAQVALLSNMLASKRADMANGLQVNNSLHDLYPAPCDCPDCEAAVSPLAYLADLLGYATQTVRTDDGDTPITLSDLEQTLHQPFGQLTAACEEMDREVRQARLCIEILRRHFRDIPPDSDHAAALADSERLYRIETYVALLSAIGTSYEQVRQIPTLDEEQRTRLAERLGIHARHLDELLLTGDNLSEQNIEVLFGLVDTSFSTVGHTRDPLSDGPTLGDRWHQIERWNLKGAEWGRNLSLDGALAVELGNPPETDVYMVRIYQFLPKGIIPGRKLVASGSSASATGPVHLSEENDSGLNGQIDIHFRDVPNQRYITLQVIPCFTCWRLEYLCNLWRKQDWPVDRYSKDDADALPVIDPDLIGPDDFRLSETGQPLFDLWSRRRQWVDFRLEELQRLTKPMTNQKGNIVGGVPDIDGMFARMDQPIDYYEEFKLPSVWDHSEDTGIPPEHFDSLLRTLTNGSKADAEEAKAHIGEALCLTAEAFIRLMEIRNKDAAWWADHDREPVSDEEWRELRSILVQAEKERFYTHWIQEEEQTAQASNLDEAFFGPKYFWPSLSEPQPGDWPPSIPAGQPMIDPELVGLDALPDSRIGHKARDLWTNRLEVLESIQRDLDEMRQNGFNAMFLYALSQSAAVQPDPNDPQSLDNYLDGLETQLNDPKTTDDAIQGILNELYLDSVDELRTLLRIRRKTIGGESVSEQEWQDVIKILTSAKKRCELYSVWTSDESDLVYWKVLKAHLPRWRASLQARRAWQEALRIRSRQPNIDPDLIDTTYLRDPFPGDPAFDTWQDRQNWVADKLEELRNHTPNNLAEWDDWIVQQLRMTDDEYELLRTQFHNGDDIDVRLEQLGLSRAAFRRLEDIRGVIAADPAQVRDEEWDEVCSILAQAAKWQEFAQWCWEEQQRDLVLSAAHFKVPEPPPLEFPPPEPAEIPRWRGTWRERRDWEDRLESRNKQAKTVVIGMKDAVSRTEENTLPTLRDALIAATGESAELLTGRFLIDAKTGGCQQTTRIAQAIETLQTLLFSLRTGQLADTRPELTLRDDDFDEKWQWLGSYAYWRAATFVFLYPENVLLPHLRRWHTPGFRKLVKELGGNRRLTPEAACEAAQRYTDYFRDVCNLELGASVQARTAYHEGECRNRAYQGDRYLVYLFARGRETNTVYFSYYDPEDASGYAQSFWKPVDGLDNVEVLDIVGAAAYTATAEQRHIYLFIRTLEKGAEKLVFTRFDLEAFRWTGEVNDPDLPEETTAFTAVVKQRNREDEPPHLAIRLPSGAVYTRMLNAEGTDWEEMDEWVPLVGQFKGRAFSYLYTMIEETSRNSFYFFVSDPEHLIYYRLFGPRDDGRWRRIGRRRTLSDGVIIIEREPAVFIGALAWPSGDRTFLFWKDESDGSVVHQPLLPRSSTDRGKFISSFGVLDDWLKAVAGLSLSGVPQFNYSVMDETRYFRGDLLAELDNQSISEQRKASLIYGFGKAIESADDLIWKEWARASQMLKDFTCCPKQPLRNALLIINNGRAFKVKLFDDPNVPDELGSPMPWQCGVDNTIIYAHGEAPAYLQGRLAYWRKTPEAGFYRCSATKSANDILTPHGELRIAPLFAGFVDITERPDLKVRRERMQFILLVFGDAPAGVKAYFEEAAYFVPLQIALQLQRRRQFTAALDWFRTVYDYTGESGDPRISYFLMEDEGSDSGTYHREADWLLDPLNPHAIAASRKGTYTRFTLLSIIRCLLDYADAQFTQDTAESLPQAQILYAKALELLHALAVNQNPGTCPEVIPEIREAYDDLQYSGSLWALQHALLEIKDPRLLREVIEDVRHILESDLPLAERLAHARTRVRDALQDQPYASDFSTVIEQSLAKREQAQVILLSDDLLAVIVENVGVAAESQMAASIVATVRAATGQMDVSPGQMELPWLRTAIGYTPEADGGQESRSAMSTGVTVTGVVQASMGANFAAVYPGSYLQMLDRMDFSYIPSSATGFCVPPNPVNRAFRLHAELNLYKLRNCRNIEGMQREVPLYGAPTDTVSGMPMIGEAGQISLPGSITIPGTPYRYDYLVERARHLAERAAQMEAAFLAALEKRDAEYYSLMKAKQDVRLARAGVRLQDLRVREAEDGATLAELQKERAQFQADTYSEWLEEGISSLEEASLALLHLTAMIQFQAAMAGFAEAAFGGSVVSALSALAGGLSTEASRLSTMASYERRRQQWEFQRDMAMQDVAIGSQQVRLSKDHVRITAQERRISQMQADFAEATADFLANKFTNVELYDWMSQILEEVYAYFLAEATNVARLAEAQLAFERQETPAGLIQVDYWEAPSDDMIAPGPDSHAPDRRGLTGSARLFTDIEKLDQHRFESEKRKLQLTRILSLASLDPFEFQRFRDTGVMNFRTDLALFDRDFPGHYLRLIKRVRLSLVALIPPTAGIHATLSTTGLSRVTVGDMGLYQTVLTRRPPESVALSSTRDATGLFELVPQTREMMLPFESMGVDTAWELRMPKPSNLFDYRTIADVLMTIEYTALDSYDYRQQVIRELDTSISADRPFSFRHQFPDAWYDLHNPDQTATPMTVRFRIRREDFPPNIEDLRIQQILLYFSCDTETLADIDVGLRMTQNGIAIPGENEAALAAPVEGVISTRRGNAGGWMIFLGKEPEGEWKLSLPDTPETRALFQEERIEDMLFVVTYSGQTPEWPE